MDYSGNTSGHREQAGHRRDEPLAAPPRSFDGDCTDSCSGGGNDGATRRLGKVPTLRRAASVTVPPGHGLARPRRLDFSDLDLPECLLIKPIRLWLHGVENWSLVSMQYKAQFGPEAAPTARALTALRGIIEILNAGGRRCMSFHKAWSRLTTGDERSLVALLAAAQAGDRDRAEAMALRLVTEDWQAPLLADIETLADSFAARGHRLVNLPARGQGRADRMGVRPVPAMPRSQSPASRP